MDVPNDLHDVLESFGLPVYLQGSMADNEPYPESFYTYYNNSTGGLTYYDNMEKSVVWDFDVSAYSANPDMAQQMLDRGVMSINEARELFNYGPVDGGELRTIRGEYKNANDSDLVGGTDDEQGNQSV